jgi:hypothetical protein
MPRIACSLFEGHSIDGGEQLDQQGLAAHPVAVLRALEQPLGDTMSTQWGSVALERGVDLGRIAG